MSELLLGYVKDLWRGIFDVCIGLSREVSGHIRTGILILAVDEYPVFFGRQKFVLKLWSWRPMQGLFLYTHGLEGAVLVSVDPGRVPQRHVSD